MSKFPSPSPPPNQSKKCETDDHVTLLFLFLSCSILEGKENCLDRTLSFIEVKTQQCSRSCKLITKSQMEAAGLAVIMQDMGEFLQEAKELLAKWLAITLSEVVI